MVLALKHLCHEIDLNRIEPIQSEIAALHRIPSWTANIELVKFLGLRIFLPKIIHTLGITIKPFYDLILGSNQFHWNKELETLFQQN